MPTWANGPTQRQALRAVLLASVLIPVHAFGQSVPAPAATPAQTAPAPQTAPAQTAPTQATPAQAPASAPTAAPAQPAPVAGADAVRVLLERASFWRGQYQPEKAVDSLNRVLSLDPRNADALAMLAQLQAERGERTAAQTALSRLRDSHPDDPRIATVDQALRVGPIDQGALTEARRLAQQGRTADAIARYQRIFHGETPPDSLATEYYQTLGGTDGGWQSARDGLARSVTSNPQDLRGQLAYAQLLTYREETRAEGINRLNLLANNPATAEAANQALRQALIWLPNAPTSVNALNVYLSRHPNDTELAQKLEAARNPPTGPVDEAGQIRVDGFAALNRNRLRDAEDKFQAALARNANDSDATGGMGIIRLRQGRRAEARTLLERAIELDPSKRDQWQQALTVASRPGGGTGPSRGGTGGYGGAERYAQAKALANRGQFDEAEAVLRRAMGPNPDSGSYLLLADIQARAGKLADSEANYRASIERDPNNGAALLGLGGVLTREGKTAEADQIFVRAEAAGRGAEAGRARAQVLRARAQEVSDPVAQAGLYRAAVAVDPTNPWLRLEFARALVKQGRTAEATQVMNDLTSRPGASPETLQAGTYFALETNQTQSASLLINRLPPRSRTPEMQTLQQRVAFQGQIEQLSQFGSRTTIRNRLLGLATQPDPQGYRVAEISRTLLRLGDPTGARDAIGTALAVTPNPTAAQRISYAGALLDAGDVNDAAALADSAQSTGRLTSAQAQSVTSLKNGIAVRASDSLNQQGRVADAYDELAPQLAAAPDNPDLNMALGRLYQTDRQPRTALAITRALLERDPNNLEVRRSAVSAAISAGEYGTAQQMIDQGMQLFPNEPRIYMMSADLARARGNNGRALRDLATARDLRRQQLNGGYQSSSAEPQEPAAAHASLTTNTAATHLGVASGVEVEPAQAAVPLEAPDYYNPFRRGSAPPPPTIDPTTTVPSILSVQGLPVQTRRRTVDPLTQDIDRSIARLQDTVAPQVQVGIAVRGRSGDAGLDQLFDVGLPIEASFSPGGSGRLKLVVTPEFLDSGRFSGVPGNVQRFGTNPLFGLGVTPTLPSQNAQGVGLDVGYNYRFITADIGTTPLGFRRENIVGGVELAPELAPGLVLRVTGERRGVNDSVLSYAGTRDPATGLVWGGVVRNRGRGQLEYSTDRANLYAGGGYDYLTGSNVASNREFEAGAGGSYALYKSPSQEVRLGLDLVGFGYDKNLRFFTYGQGGYFSPKTFFAALFPLSYREQVNEDFYYKIGGTLGFQTFHESSSPVFPTDGGRQQQLQQIANLATTPPGLITRFPSKTTSGVAGGINGEFDYRVTNNIHIGGKASVQHFGNYTEGVGLLYARYIFNGSPP